MKGYFYIPCSEDEALALLKLCEGLRSGHDRDALHPLIETVQAMQDRALSSPEGIAYLEDRPNLKQHREHRLERLNQQSQLPIGHPSDQ